MSTFHIYILDKTVAERIAAGEVVERRSTPTTPDAPLEMKPPSTMPTTYAKKSRTWRGRRACVPHSRIFGIVA